MGVASLLASRLCRVGFPLSPRCTRFPVATFTQFNQLGKIFWRRNLLHIPVRVFGGARNIIFQDSRGCVQKGDYGWLFLEITHIRVVVPRRQLVDLFYCSLNASTEMPNISATIKWGWDTRG